jgi:cell division septum initiation protein DivIVA
MQNQQRVLDLAQQIEELSTELKHLLSIEDSSNLQPEIKVGDTVEIINNYGNLRGQQATVNKVTRVQIALRLVIHEKVIYKKKSNVALILPDEGQEQ